MTRAFPCHDIILTISSDKRLIRIERTLLIVPCFFSICKWTMCRIIELHLYIVVREDFLFRYISLSFLRVNYCSIAKRLTGKKSWLIFIHFRPPLNGCAAQVKMVHDSDVTWASYRLKSPATHLLSVYSNQPEKATLRITGLFWGDSNQWNSFTKGQ